MFFVIKSNVASVFRSTVVVISCIVRASIELFVWLIVAQLTVLLMVALLTVS